MGWAIHKITMKRSAYEQTLDDKAYSRINEYDNTDKLFKKEVC